MLTPCSKTAAGLHLDLKPYAANPDPSPQGVWQTAAGVAFGSQAPDCRGHLRRVYQRTALGGRGGLKPLMVLTLVVQIRARLITLVAQIRALAFWTLATLPYIVALIRNLRSDVECESGPFVTSGPP